MWELFQKGGFIMWPLLFISVLTLALALAESLRLRTLLDHAAGIIPSGSPLSDLNREGSDRRELRGHVIRILHEETCRVEHLALAAALAPLLGLTGTVFGIIRSFMVMGSGRVSAEILASGMWEALLTTAAGLIVGMVAHTAHHVLTGRLSRLAILLDQRTERAPCPSDSEPGDANVASGTRRSHSHA